MRTALLLACATAACVIAGTAACTDASETPVETPDDGGGTTVGEAGAEAGMSDAGADAAHDASGCSPAGWCPTPLPASDLTVKDIWPLPEHAFAVAESPTLGIKVLEWAEATATWSYVDDNTQNESGIGDYAGTLWAPNENELYYTVSPGYVYHGTRAATPGTGWSWVRHSLPDNAPNTDVGNPDYDTGRPQYIDLTLAVSGFLGYPALGVHGTSANDVYAWYSNTIFHWKPNDAGVPSWVAEYTLEAGAEPGEHLFFLGGGSSGPNDVWFSGARSLALGSCAIVVHKTPAGYARIVDGTISNPHDYESKSCTEKAGSLALVGQMTHIQSLGPGRAFGLDFTYGLVELTAGTTNSDWTFRASKPVAAGTSNAFLSMWTASEEEHWFSTNGVVLQGKDVWTDGGTYEISSLAMNGSPLRKLFYQVRGTSNSNLWAVGEGYALHKYAAQ